MCGLDIQTGEDDDERRKPDQDSEESGIKAQREASLMHFHLLVYNMLADSQLERLQGWK